MSLLPRRTSRDCAIPSPDFPPDTASPGGVGGLSSGQTPSIPAARARKLVAMVARGRGKKRLLRVSMKEARRMGLKVPVVETKPAHQDPFNPQDRLTRALRERLGEQAVLSEVGELVPGRRYRADIALPQHRLIVEFDGFQYHRSKAAFQGDRERQNAFVAQGWRVLRFFHQQVRNDLEGVVAQILEVAARGGAVHKE